MIARHACVVRPHCKLLATPPRHAGRLQTRARADGKGEAVCTGSQVPGGLRTRRSCNKLVPTLVPLRQLLGGARVGRCHGLLEELALAFAMGTHERLGAGSAAAGGVGGRRRSRRAQGKAPAAMREEEGCLYLMMPADLVKRVVEACGWWAEGELWCGCWGGGGRAGRFETERDRGERERNKGGERK